APFGNIQQTAPFRYFVAFNVCQQRLQCSEKCIHIRCIGPTLASWIRSIASNTPASSLVPIVFAKTGTLHGVRGCVLETLFSTSQSIRQNKPAARVMDAVEDSRAHSWTYGDEG